MPRVLVAEDDATIREVVVGTLTDEGYHVEAYADGAELVRALEVDPHPCLVLLDMRMPRLDGWGVARLIRERSWNVRLCVMTAAADARAWAAEVAADAYLAKPFTLLTLLTTVERYCGPA